MRQIIITPACGKRLIAKAIASHPDVLETLQSGTLVIIAGTTNAYVAEEILANMDEQDDFSRNGFFRGITTPPSRIAGGSGRIHQNHFPGDVIIRKGKWEKDKTIFDVVDDLKAGDVVLKGANAVNPVECRAGILIGHPKGGTILSALQAVIGRRVKLILPVGLEKRVCLDIETIAELINKPEAKGPRMLPVTGEVVTEIEALNILTGLNAELVAGGGVAGAEGSVWLAVKSGHTDEEQLKELIKSVSTEPMFQLA